MDLIFFHKKNGMSTIMTIEPLSKKIKNNMHKKPEKTMNHKGNILCNRSLMFSKVKNL